MSKITLYQAAQVLTGRPCSGEKLGWATTDFCDAVVKITKDDSPEVSNGYARAIVASASAAKEALTERHSDLAQTITTELDLDVVTPTQAVEAINNWCAENQGRFPAELEC